MSTPTRDRIIETGAGLLLRQGYVGTGMKQIVDGAGAPFGSVYHHFPGGKEELGAEAVRWSGAVFGRMVGEVLAAELDVVHAVETVFAAAAEALVAADYADACPIATVALEVSSTSEPLRQACADVFESWIDGLSGRFMAEGLDLEGARALAQVFLMLLEGAFLLCRASRTTEAMSAARAAAAAATRAALDHVAASGGLDGR